MKIQNQQAQIEALQGLLKIEQDRHDRETLGMIQRVYDNAGAKMEDYDFNIYGLTFKKTVKPEPAKTEVKPSEPPAGGGK